MNADRLLEHFERISDAADAVPRLRPFVLDLAVRGKLLPQNDRESFDPKAMADAAIWLSNEAERLEVRWKPGETPTKQELDSPGNWISAQVNDTGLYINGLAFKPTDWGPTGTPIIRIQNLTDSTKDFNHAKGTYAEAVTVQNGDILVSWSATLDAFLWNRGKGVLNQHIFRVIPSPLVTPHFLHLLLRVVIRRIADSDHAHGLVMKHVNRGPFLAHEVSLPPLAEQHRIVTKVDELMVLCDRLEAAQAERKARRDRLVSASLARVTEPDSDDATSATTSARFHLDHFARLTTRPEHVKQLRQTILNLAVRGRLVPHNPADASVDSLIHNIAHAKAALREKTHDRRIKPALTPEQSKLPFTIPGHWTVESFENLFLFIDYRGKTPPKTAEGIPLITAKNIRMGFLNREPREFISSKTFASWMSRGIPRLGDVFFTTEAPLANVCLNTLEEPFALAQRVVCLQPYGDVDTKFIMFAVMSPLMQCLIDAHATGTTARGIKTAKLKPLPIPLPPLAEQRRIVAKVDELMALCDQLEASLASAATDQARLLEALLDEALAPAA